MVFTSLFANSNTSASNTSGSTLAGTQQLTNTANAIANQIMTNINESDDESLAGDLQLSMTDANVLDTLIKSQYDLTTIDDSFLKSLDEATLDGMLKSQQSKRSRCKSKEMTMDNYTSMMTAAIAESLIRLAIGKEKGTSGGRAGSAVAYSESRLAELAADQDALRKEIRNVQSKKSIMKSKVGFTESDDRWQSLLVAEEQLKGIRSDAPAAVKVVDNLRADLKEFLAEVDETTMKAADLKELVAYIKRQVWSDTTEETTNAQ
jgi:hypothetical protein